MARRAPASSWSSSHVLAGLLGLLLLSAFAILFAMTPITHDMDTAAVDQPRQAVRAESAPSPLDSMVVVGQSETASLLVPREEVDQLAARIADRLAHRALKPIAFDQASLGARADDSPAQPAAWLGDAVGRQELPRARFKSQEGLEELGGRQSEEVAAYDPKDGRLVLHIIPHTHLDPGWLKTFAQYHSEYVERILDTVVAALEANPQRRFNWVEICFLSRWWEQRSRSWHERVRALWRRGQLEFVMGGWVSNDEACVNYVQAVNHLTEGHRWLREHIDPEVTPRVAWQIDPFGLSAAMAYLFAEMGFEAHAGWRISEPEMEVLQQRKQLEFIWQPLASRGSSELLMHLLPYSYTCPGEYLFDANLISRAKAGELAKALAGQVLGRARHLSHPRHLMWLWGHDFHFTNAHNMFGSMDLIVEAINANPSLGVQAVYSTPNSYFAALRRDGFAFPRFSGRDFMPYQAGPVNWWSGYFTSRPHLKRSLRVLDSLLRSSEAALFMHALLQRPADQQRNKLFAHVESARHRNGVLQHHDAITGTMRMHVLRDYYAMIDDSVDDCLHVLRAAVAALGQLVGPRLLSPSLPVPHDLPPSVVASSRVYFAVYNSLAHVVTGQLLHVRVQSPAEPASSWQLRRVVDGAPVRSELFPCVQRPDCSAKTEAELLFDADLQPLALHYFAWERRPSSSAGDGTSTPTVRTSEQGRNQQAPLLTNERLLVSFSSQGVPSAIQLDGRTTAVGHQFYKYGSDSAWANQYTFKASRDTPDQFGDYSQWILVAGALRQELFVDVSSEVKRRYRLDAGALHLDVVDEVNPRTNVGADIVSRWSLPTWRTRGVLYTDANGLLPLERQHRDGVMISGNYWPSVYSAELRDGDDVFLSACDTPEGVGSPADGSLERMLHRVAMQSQGNGEAMTEGGLAVVTSRIALGPASVVAPLRARLAFELNFPPVVMQFDAFSSGVEPRRLSPLPLRAPLPPQLFLTSMQLYNATTYMLRVQHVGAPFLAIDWDIADMFSADLPPLVEIEERTLTALHPVGANPRRPWPAVGGAVATSMPSTQLSWAPYQIRTFFVFFQKQSH